jgi:signal transduction histidine kinase
MTIFHEATTDGGPPPSVVSSRPEQESRIVLADGRVTAQAEPDAVRPRRVVAQLVVAALVVMILVGVGGAAVSKRVAEQQAVHDVAEITDVIAAGAIQPALTEAMLTDPQLARTALDPVVRAALLSASIVRVKLWTPDGVVLYSDESRLTGQAFALDTEARSALTAPQVEASISDLGRPENQYERSRGRLLEVYRPVWTPQGHPLLLETYFTYDSVQRRSNELWRGFAGIMLTSLLALLVLLAPVVWSLSRRTRRAQAQRQAMAGRALAASDAERARIAASLHDGIVQQLVAASLRLSAGADRAAADGDRQRAADLDDAAATVRSSVGGLRSVLVDIYPPDLRQRGLASAVNDAVATLAGTGPRIEVELDEEAVEALTPDEVEAVFRIVQELLRNAVKHSEASLVTVRLAAVDGGVELLVDDDGVGFEAGPNADGHLGLQLITDAARRVGAELVLVSRPGAGAHYRMWLP